MCVTPVEEVEDAVKLHVNRDLLSDAVSFVVKLLPQRTTLPILSGVLLNASGQSLTLSTFDYEVSAQTSVPADISVEGEVLVSARLLSDISHRLPNEDVVLEISDSKLTITSGQSTFVVYTMPVDEYPKLPTVESWSGEIDAEEFATAVTQVAIAASRDDVTPVLTGVEVTVSGDSLTLVATDRYRVALRTIPWTNSGGTSELSALIPARTIGEVAKTFSNQGIVTIAITHDTDHDMVAFRAGSKQVTTLLIKGNFPPVTRLLPDAVPNFAVVKTSDLIEASRRVGLVLDRESPLRFTFSIDGLLLEAVGSDQAQATEQVEAFLSKDDVVVSMKPQLLIDALSHIHTEYAKLGFTTTDNPNKPGPVLITGQVAKDAETVDNYKYLLQPNLLLR